MDLYKMIKRGGVMSNSIQTASADESTQLLSIISKTKKIIDLSIADLKSTNTSSFEELYKNALAENIVSSGSGTSSFSPASLLGSLSSPLQGYTISGETSSVQTGTAGAMQTSGSAVAFIAQHEGFMPTAYRGIDYQNQTIGYGHVIQPGESFDTLTPQQGQQLLKKDLTQFENSVNKEFSGTNLSQNQFDALVSFSYNTGANVWSKVPKLTGDIKSGASADVLKADFSACSNCNGQYVQGLNNRRMDEWQMFTGGNTAQV
jgi:lysozyme